MPSGVIGLTVVRFMATLSSSVAVQTTLHCQRQGAVPNDHAALVALAENAAAWWVDPDGMQQLQSVALNLDSVQVEDLSETVLATVEVPIAEVGAVAGDAAPSSTALVVTMKTDYAGRAFRGRMYWGGFPAASVASGGLSWESTLVDAAQDSIQALVDGIPAADYDPVIFHREGDDTTPITSVLARSALRQQRRREYGVGA